MTPSPLRNRKANQKGVTLLVRFAPELARKIELRVLMRTFARAFDVEPPNMDGLSADGMLAWFREFTAACMEAAAADSGLAARYRKRLGADAYALGRELRRFLAIEPEEAMTIAQYLYRGIGIELAGELPGDLRFGPCSFACRYTPADCFIMSAFDEGILRGLSGLEDGNLGFSRRLTEGCDCCRAAFGACVPGSLDG